MDVSAPTHLQKIVIFVVFIIHFSDSASPSLTLIHSFTNPSIFPYAAESKIYPEEPYVMYITCRGGGVTAMDVRGAAAGQLVLKGRWNSTATVEGQDRAGDLLVVARLGRGPDGALAHGKRSMLTRDVQLLALPGAFTVRSVRASHLTPSATIDLSAYTDAILHVKLYTDPSGIRWAICTAGFATTLQGGVIAVKLQQDLVVHTLSTPVEQPEGVTIVADYAYIGGINSTSLAVVSIANPQNMSVVHVMKSVSGLHRYGSQLVAAPGPTVPIVLAAVWGVPGGLVALNTSDPSAPSQILEVASVLFAFANRAKLYKDISLIPLEQAHVAAIGFVNVSDPAALATLGTYHFDVSLVHNTKSYCLEGTNDGVVISFVAETSEMYIFQLQGV